MQYVILSITLFYYALCIMHYALLAMEVLSPAGNLQKLKYAIAYGADAVYAGSQDFSLRAAADTFTHDDLLEATAHCHAHGKKIYVPLNIYAHNRHIDPIRKYIQNLADAQIDAVIVSDIGVFSLVKEIAPQIPIHISTQANVTSYQAVQAWQKLGAKRIILARELSAPEIATIKEKCPDMQLEIFVHGAMCMAYSGRCMLSAYLNQKSANLGQCTHPCRWNYSIVGTPFMVSDINSFSLVEESRPDQSFPIQEDAHGFYFLNSKDLCLWDRLSEIYDMCIDSIKIEGRMKSVYYISAITRAYKHAVTQITQGLPTDPTYKDELYKVSHRLYTEAFFASEPDIQSLHTTQYDRAYQFIGNIISVKGDLALVQSFQKATTDHTFEVIFPDKKYDISLQNPEIFDTDMNPIPFTKPNSQFYIRLGINIPEWGIVRALS